eukprot:TRINITY_DN4840_c0_g1_i1.p1 TRINITY_DN4840_c0_g1~~TRINITY_DN4840_c0_g1_i1.p1  ORF type:complete len:616 (+),score=211.95 TRINITY_DN4840_c0_g1_i1:27-1850(+)
MSSSGGGSSEGGSGSTGGGGGFGLEEIGVPGREYLREALTSCTDPLKAIEDFQVENGILLPSLRPMLPLLDLHGIKRLDFHNSVLEDLRERLIAQLEELSSPKSKGCPSEKDSKLKELLLKSFPVIKIKQLRPVVMAVLKHMSVIEDKYLRVLVKDKELYADCDIVIKRHLWRDNQSLFGDEVSPYLSQYIKDKETVLYGIESNTGFFGNSPKGRRQAEVIQKLAHMIGSNVKLYDMILQFLRTLFLRTRNVHYCTLRAELLMALHELEIQDIISVDPCHKFTWCLDACIREKNVDVKRSRELQGFLDAIRRGQVQVLGDLSMTLCDPFAINFLAASAMKILNHQVNNDGLPRDNSILHLLLRMLILGLSAWEMINSQEFAEPKPDPALITKFIPALMSLIVDDQVRALNTKLPADERESAITIIEHSGPPPDACQVFIEKNLVATTLAMHYTLQVARSKDKTGLMRILGLLSNSVKGHPFQDSFMHCLVTSLTAMRDDFESEDFCTVVFDEFFFANITTESYVRHLLRLLWAVYTKINSTRLKNLMKLAEPGNVNVNSGVGSSLGPSPLGDPIIKIYGDLSERIDAHNANLAAMSAEEDKRTDSII